MEPESRKHSFQEGLGSLGSDQRRVMNGLVMLFARQINVGLLRDEMESPGLEACVEGLEALWEEGYLNFCHDGEAFWMEMWDEDQGTYVAAGRPNGPQKG